MAFITQTDFLKKRTGQAKYFLFRNIESEVLTKVRRIIIYRKTNELKSKKILGFLSVGFWESWPENRNVEHTSLGEIRRIFACSAPISV